MSDESVLSISTGVNSGPESIAITPSGELAYVANSGNNTVAVIATGNNAIVSMISGFVQPIAVAITPDGRFAYVVNYGNNTVSIVNIADNTIIGSPITVGSYPIAIAITPNGNFAYVANQSGNSISVISTSSKTVVATIPFVGTAPSAIAITPNGSFAYVANERSDNVAVIDTNTNTKLTSITSSSFATPGGVAITPDGSFVYVTNHNSHNVVMIDANSNLVTGTVSFNGINSGISSIAITPNQVFPTPGPPDLPTPSDSGGDSDGASTQENNDFGLGYEIFTILRWQPSPSEVVGYFVYRDGVKIATVSNSTFEYQDHNRPEGQRTLYAVTSFNSNGVESSPIHFVVN